MSADLAIVAPRTAAERMPVAKARHIHAAALPQWRALLEFHWRERLERVIELSLAYHDAEQAAAQASSEGLLAARRHTRAVMREAVTQRRALAEIDAALSRLPTGRFGWCEQCGSVVGTTRLAETPQTRYCAACDC